MSSILNVIAMAGGQAGGNAQGQAGGGYEMLFIFIAIMGLMYFMMIRPQRRKEKERQEMLKRIQTGDKVRTVGGLMGTVSAVTERTIKIRVSSNVDIEFMREAVMLTEESMQAAKAEDAEKASAK